MKFEMEALLLPPIWLCPTVREGVKTFTKEFKGKSMEEVFAFVERCNNCPMRAEARRPVGSEGWIQSEYFFCGRNPGEWEDLNGRPFYPKAQAGKLLNYYLDVLEVKREDVYITNALFCHSERNRSPITAERQSCLMWKFLEFERLPKVRYIFLFGNDSTKSCLGEEYSIMRKFGVILQTRVGERSYLIFPSYHPAHVLRQPDLSQTQLDFIGMAKEIISLDKSGKLDWRV